MTGLRIAVAMFTALPVPRTWHSVTTAAGAVPWLPAVGVVLGGIAGLPAALGVDRGVPVVGSVLAIAALAALTRGLHLDGLADTADGLGSRADPIRALEIMRRSDIGPFGVVSVVLVLLADVAALASTDGSAGASTGTAEVWRPVAALAIAAATGRLAVVHASVRGVRSARTSGFGALVAGDTAPAVAVAVSVPVLGAGALAGWLAGASPGVWVAAQLAGLLVATAMRWHTTRRLGGVTGDVFGALVEVGTAVTLVVVALGS